MIVYQDILSPRPETARTPAPLVGALSLSRRDCTAGDLVTLGEPLGDLDVPGEGVACLDLADGWRCWQVGEFVPELYLRRGMGSLDLLPVSDALGRAWHAPAIIAPGVEPRDGIVVLSLPWGFDGQGLPARIATAPQARLITAARAARAEILAGQLGAMPVSVAVALVAPLLESVYHLTIAQVLGWQLIDDSLAAALLMASAGFLRPREN